MVVVVRILPSLITPGRETSQIMALLSKIPRLHPSHQTSFDRCTLDTAVGWLLAVK